ncbi:MAG: PrpF domain-containing protein [Sedimentibacter sp.]|uniref:2-methylaconitate cis-trans isomerase PrpF family protein n=1 Tax=Sedimentibacter sp. TaxID=1960295 RepID=UPI0031584330
MYRESFSVPCSIIRGGTSKGVFFLENSLPPAGQMRDNIILSAFGSPDSRQIDGLGGANSLTSKVCIIGPSQREDADVDYTYGQVSLDKAMIDWEGNCGNMVSAVGIFAVQNNLLKPVEPFTVVRIYNTNSSKIIHVTYPVRDGLVLSQGDYAIPGVPGTGAKLKVEFFDPAGSVTKKLLPTGNTKDVINLNEKGSYTVSIVDSGNPVIFVKAEDLSLKGYELPAQIEGTPGVLDILEEIRSICAELTGIVADRSMATAKSPAYPKICIVSKPQDYTGTENRQVRAEDVDLLARMAALQKIHKTFAVTAAVCTGAAAKIEGTIVNQLISQRAKESETLVIGHPYGPMEVTVHMENGHIIKEGIYRTARKIMDGSVFIPHTKLGV